MYVCTPGKCGDLPTQLITSNMKKLLAIFNQIYHLSFDQLMWAKEKKIFQKPHPLFIASKEYELCGYYFSKTYFCKLITMHLK